ncbi:MAG: hypothetical protein J0G32_00830 [Alphaproteobacteria bacterium]|nr:hypothetical protein [Alphaproteobacteria bacterium]OJV14117.1 MAG: hypothetical protein BGO27_01355 [Alphaproteobacteria bacterium 33-17]
MVKNYKLSDLNQKAYVHKAEVRKGLFGSSETVYTKSYNIWVKLEPIIAEQTVPYSPASGVVQVNATYKVVTNSSKNITKGDIISIKYQKLKIFKIYTLNDPFKMFITEEIE